MNLCTCKKLRMKRPTKAHKQADASVLLFPKITTLMLVVGSEGADSTGSYDSEDFARDRSRSPCSTGRIGQLAMRVQHGRLYQMIVRSPLTGRLLIDSALSI